MKGAAAFRGQPLLVLGGLLFAWIGLRAAWWEPTFEPALLAAPRAVVAPFAQVMPAAAASRRFGPPPQSRAQVLASAMPALIGWRESWPARSIVAAAVREPLPQLADVATRVPPPAVERNTTPLRAAVGHSLLLAAGLSGMELPPALAAYIRGDAQPAPGVPAAAPALASLPQHAPPITGSRLSADTWLMLRNDTTTAVVSGRPSYGRSQAGAVVRYRLARSSPHAPQAYLRASSAVTGPRDEDLAAGLSGRPLPRVPLRLAAEARLSRTAAGTELRPAAIAVTEFPPVELPLAMRAEAYVQGGYVGGRFATAFVDGQGRIDRPLGRLGGAEVRAGVGGWGGAQKGAARLDIGPTAAVSFRLGEARGRLAADYRFRIAGDADPKSGPALTLSAGF